MNRREAIKRASFLLGGVISASAVTGVLNGCKADPAAAGAWQFLTPQEGSLLDAIVDRIIPRTDTPGALDAGVPAFIDTMLAEFYQDQEKKLIRDGLAQADADARAAHGAGFATLPSEQQDEILRGYDADAYAEGRARNDKHFFRLLKELTVLGFCTSEVGATEFLRYEPVPGQYKGCIPFEEVGVTWAT
ncbi:MAG: hypothetical protein RLY31_172 [Bacteroidota bacterium]|jgi:hypothetical protein